MRFSSISQIPPTLTRCIAASALAIMALGSTLSARNTDSIALEDTVRITLEADYFDLDDLESDVGFRRLASDLARFQSQSGSEALDLTELRGYLNPAFDQVDVLEDEWEYAVVCINGQDILICRLVQRVTISDPTLPRTVTLVQEIDTAL